MQSLVVRWALLFFAARSMAPFKRSETRPVPPAQVRASELHKASLDTVIQFLLTSAAADFYAHRPPTPARFCNVRLRPMMASDDRSAAGSGASFFRSRREATSSGLPLPRSKPRIMNNGSASRAIARVPRSSGTRWAICHLPCQAGSNPYGKLRIPCASRMLQDPAIHCQHAARIR